MGKLSVFGITLEGNRTVYFPGDFIKGQVLIQVTEPMKMKAIKIMCVGRAYVHWTETRTTGSGENQRTETENYSETENLFEQTIIVHGEGANEQTNLSQGQHVFPFQYQLPTPLPSSYEDGIGYIRYWVKGTIVKPWKFDKYTTQVFTVLDTLDLNNIPNISTPSGNSDTKTLCCWCCTSGPIEAEFHTDRSGYVPGEYILINAAITNSSYSKVKYTSAMLMQNVTYHATTKTRIDSRVVNTIMGPGVDKRATENWTNKRLHIPPLPPSESLHCRIIDITYSVIFQAHLRTCAVDMRLYAPITIGTIPIRSLQMYRNPPPSIGNQRLAVAPSALPIHNFPPNTSPNPEQATSAYPTRGTFYSPPPSYPSATGGGAIIKDDDYGYTMGDTSFTPQYTYYDWNQSTFTSNK
uniref:arrestin domain-containing protein 3-like n=1 Tax=Styela clava TaxID=7725 RepID=UPI00193A9176|nr:arrestin domain-containing protein 3-like [Styela clava]